MRYYSKTCRCVVTSISHKMFACWFLSCRKCVYTQKVYFDWVYGLGICKLINMRICCVIVFFGRKKHVGTPETAEAVMFALLRWKNMVQIMCVTVDKVGLIVVCQHFPHILHCNCDLIECIFTDSSFISN